MAKSTVTKTKASSAQPEQENVVVESTSVPTEKKVKKVKAPKEAVSAPVETAPVVVAESVSVPVDQVVEVENSIAEKGLDFTAKLQQIGNLIASLKPEFKNIEKMYLRELKASQKLNTKRKRKSGNRPPSGFVKPTRISDELAKFLDKPVGSEMARTDVTKDINAYIRANKLQDEVNGRKILPDKKLATLLKIKQNEELTYFNLQKFMSIHFAKAGAKVTPQPTAGGGVTASA
uniref:DM2 domain-containing protein n=1 Tax=viral metagenome TaxID=1070528 RepID=A0A6C0E4S0_9ZZZZ